MVRYQASQLRGDAIINDTPCWRQTGTIGITIRTFDATFIMNLLTTVDLCASKGNAITIFLNI